MPRFRKKPVIIYAQRGFTDEHVEGVQYKIVPDPLGPGPGARVAYIHTLEGDMRVSEGDWIITGVRGEQYPCKDGIFQQTYELVPDPYRNERPETD
jgi:hypothetical protein